MRTAIPAAVLLLGLVLGLIISEVQQLSLTTEVGRVEALKGSDGTKITITPFQSCTFFDKELKLDPFAHDYNRLSNGSVGLSGICIQPDPEKIHRDDVPS